MISTYFNGGHSLGLNQIGWRQYNKIKKKAMEQEFSWSGLCLSLSIAFFIVIIAAFALNFAYNSISSQDLGINAQILQEKDQVQELSPSQIRSLYSYQA
jgi:hypothetical protein